MAQEPQADEITPQIIQQGIISMKKALSQIEGECTTMRQDAQSKIFENMVNICNRFIQEMEMLKKANKDYVDTLEKIYQAHPDLKISMTKQKTMEPKASIGEKATIKVTETKS